jgi:Uma2 family endonuclease
VRRAGRSRHHCGGWSRRAPTAPLDVALGDDTVLQPDLLVCRDEDLTPRDLPTAPLLAVEVLSPSTRRIDMTLKRSIYEAAGCPSFWTVDPDGPAITAWELRDGRYVEVASAEGAQNCSLTLPFPVTLCPPDLVR